MVRTLCRIVEYLLLRGMELFHLSSTIRDLARSDRRAFPAQNHGLSGILNQEVSRDRLLGHDLECTVCKVFVCDAIVVQKRYVGIRREGLP